MLERTKYGVEYFSRPPHESSKLRWLVLAVVILGTCSLSWSIYTRFRDRAGDLQLEEESAKVDDATEEVVVPEIEMPKPIPDSKVVLSKRPAKVRNLLMRLEEAEKRRDVEMAISTIEQLRSLPGSPAADLDNSLAIRLGTLNYRRLFTRKASQWVKQIEVKRGDSASRLAYENGSTLASMAALNGGNVNKLLIGQKVYVMDHPRFSLVVHRRSRSADLSLNGKFFKRYELTDEVRGKEGTYQFEGGVRACFGRLGIEMSASNIAELEMMIPTKSSLFISEM